MAYLLRRRKLGRTSCREISTFSKTGIKNVRNDQPLPQGPDELVFRWGCTSNVPQRFVVNQARAIHMVADKTGFRKVLEEAELCPATWFDKRHPVLRDKMAAGEEVVVRPQVHHQGRHFYTARSEAELKAACDHAGPGYYISKYIPKVAEYRVFVVQGRVACVAQKTPADANAKAWNVAQGGRFDNVRWDDWPLKAIRVSIEAFQLSGLDFGGVDVMVDAEGEAYILEINSAPSLTSPYRQECMAKCFDWIVNHGKETIPMVEERGGYLKFIHPAITERARMVQ